MFTNASNSNSHNAVDGDTEGKDLFSLQLLIRARYIDWMTYQCSQDKIIIQIVMTAFVRTGVEAKDDGENGQNGQDGAHGYDGVGLAIECLTVTHCW